jgi:hypothetical protein
MFERQRLEEILGHPLMSEEWLSTSDACKVLNTTPVTIQRAIWSGWFEGRNIAIGLRRPRWRVSTASIRSRLEEELSKLDMKELSKQKPAVEPSGNELTEVS